MQFYPKAILSGQPNFQKLVKFSSTLPLSALKMNKEMLHFHESLPRLPVAPLQPSLERYLQSVRPLATDEEYQNTCKIVKEFGAPDGIGVKLHSALLEKAKNTNNWLSEWWKNYAYLSVRNSYLNNSTCGIFFDVKDFNNEDEYLRYSAKMVAAFLDFKCSLDRLTKKDVDVMSGQVLDMTQYYDAFAVCRIPGSPQDSHAYTYLDEEPPKHIIVVHNNQFFRCDVFDDHGKAINENQLYSQLQNVIQQSREPHVPIGLLTTLHRDKWFKAYSTLRKYDPVNEKSIETIQKSLFILCLDKPVTNKETPDRMSAAIFELLHGGGSEKNSGNRWFDKTLQVVVNRDGVFGITFEHSAIDGQMLMRLKKHMSDYEEKSEYFEEVHHTTEFPEPKKLEFSVSKETVEDIEEAKKDLVSIVAELETSFVAFHKFGTDFLESKKLNSDSFIQMALQLGFYKIHGVPAATYESASTRKFLYGRTDVIRSTSVESVNFCRQMTEKSSSWNSKMSSLRNAVDVHKKYVWQAVNGMAFDRLFLGLKQIALESGITVPELFEDISYYKSSYFRISSSQVPLAPNGFGLYGVLVPDGYGACYNPHSSHIRICCSSSNSCLKTSAKDYTKAVLDALNEMHSVVMSSQS